MRKLTETSFQTETPLIVKRSFISHGRRYQRGSAYPWKDLGIPPEKVDRLFRTGHVVHSEAPAEVVTEDVAEPDKFASMTLKQLQAHAAMVGLEPTRPKSKQLAEIRAHEAKSDTAA